jgi:hypothetical protein
MSYGPKFLEAEESRALGTAALERQRAALAPGAGSHVADEWSRANAELLPPRIANLLTLSLDDANGVYRGAAHRQPPQQSIELGAAAASPGFATGRLSPGVWTLTLSVHALVTSYCDVSIQIGAESATSAP